MRLPVPLATLALCLGLFGCQTIPPPEPAVKTQEVDLGIPTPCQVVLTPADPYPDSDVALANVPDIFKAVQLLLVGRKLRVARENKLIEQLKVCINPGAK